MIRTERLLLRNWTDEDLAPFAEMNADPEVMEWFPSTLNKEESDQLAKAIKSEIDKKDWGLWAVSVPGISNFIGFIGIREVPYSTPFTPAVEIGWRLARKYWGKGYATEGATASLKYGFETLKLPEIVAFTTTQNKRSIAVMEKIGMHHDPKDDFDHPRLEEGHPLRRHVLYRITEKDSPKTRM